MTTAHLTDTTLAVRLTRGEKITGLLRDFDVPLSAVRSARVEPDGLSAASVCELPGLALPWHRKIGTLAQSRPAHCCCRAPWPAGAVR
jgi:hypothetical protein